MPRSTGLAATLVFALAWLAPAHAQPPTALPDSVQVSPADTARIEPPPAVPPSAEPRIMRHSAWAIYTGDGDDNFAGGAYRFRPSVAVNAGLVAGATVRLENVHTLQELRPHYNLQREEATRLLAWAGAEGVLHLAGPVGAYAGLAVGRCIGDQSGTSVDPESAWTPVIDAGLSYNVQYEGMGGMVRAGYQYANRVTSDDHAASLGLGLEF